MYIKERYKMGSKFVIHRNKKGGENIQNVSITELRRISGKPYITTQEAAAEMGITERTVRNRMNEIEELKDRYGEYSTIRDGGIVMINYLALVDYCHFRKQLRQKNAKKYVPPYDPAKVAHEIAWYADKEG